MEVGGLGFDGFAAMMGGRIASARHLGGQASPQPSASSRAATAGPDLPSRLAAREALVRKLRGALADVLAKLDGVKKEVVRLRQENAQLRAQIGAVQSSAQKVWRVASKKRAEVEESEVEAAPEITEPEEVIEGEVVEINDDPYGSDDENILG